MQTINDTPGHLHLGAATVLDGMAGRNVVRLMDKHLDACVVMDTDGTVVTMGHLYCRIRRYQPCYVRIDISRVWL